jgi:hypothetical protein
MSINSKFIGKIVAVRGIGSGINVGRCAAIEGTQVLLEPKNYFCPSWEYSSNSHGAFHSLANGDIKGGTITLTERDTIITDAAQVVLCDEKVMNVLEKCGKA